MREGERQRSTAFSSADSPSNIILPHQINSTSPKWTTADFHPQSLAYNPVTCRCSFFFFRYNKYNWFYFFRYDKSGRFYFCRFHRFPLCCAVFWVVFLGSAQHIIGSFYQMWQKNILVFKILRFSNKILCLNGGVHMTRVFLAGFIERWGGAEKKKKKKQLKIVLKMKSSSFCAQFRFMEGVNATFRNLEIWLSEMRNTADHQKASDNKIQITTLVLTQGALSSTGFQLYSSKLDLDHN